MKGAPVFYQCRGQTIMSGYFLYAVSADKVLL